MVMDHIILPDLPAVDGLIVHTSLEGEVGSSLLSSLEGVPGNEEIRAALTETDIVQQRKGWLVAEVHHRIVAAAVIESWHEEDGRWVYQIRGWVSPDWRRQGFGTAILHWGETASHHADDFIKGSKFNDGQYGTKNLFLHAWHFGVGILQDRGGKEPF